MTDRHRLTLAWRDGREETVRASEDETVLEGAGSDGVRLPFGCRTGACVSCVCRLDSGEISYERPPRALKPPQRRSGYVLSCIARPRTDCQLAVGPAVRTELVSNPLE